MDMPDETMLRVMIVDDNADTAHSLAVLISAWGFAAKVARDGSSAVKLAVDFQPTVVLLDLSLPDRHGYDVARQLRQESQGRRIYFVAVTGWGQIADQLQSNAAGVSHHLIKPVNPDALKMILDGYEAALGVTS